MLTRELLDEIERLEEVLDYDRSTVFKIKKEEESIRKEIAKQIERAQKIIDGFKELPIELKRLCRKLTIYYAFLERDKELAFKYAEKSFSGAK